MLRRESAARVRTDPLWQAWLTETCNPYAWRKLHAALARHARVQPTLDELLSWQDSGIVPTPALTWATGEALYDSGVESASGLLALLMAGHLGSIVCILASRGGRWAEILHAAFLAVAPHAVHGNAPDRISLLPSPYREIVTLRAEERVALRELWAQWGGQPLLPVRTSGYYRGLLEMVSDDASTLGERRRLFDAVIASDLPGNWHQDVQRRAQVDAA